MGKMQSEQVEKEKKNDELYEKYVCGEDFLADVRKQAEILKKSARKVK